MKLLQCEKCDATLVYLGGDEQYISCSIRCRCSARYIIRGGDMQRVELDDINVAVIKDIEEDSKTTPAQKHSALKRLAERAKKQRAANDVIYAKVIIEAKRGQDRWFKAMNKQAATLYKKKELSMAAKICIMAAQVKDLKVNGNPWDPSRMSDEEYIEATARAIGADMGTL